MFDNKSVKTTSNISAFGVTSTGTLSSFTNDDYVIVMVPDNVVSLSNGVFEGFTTIKSIVLPKNLTSISAEAFLNCSGLRGIVVPDLVT